MIGLVLVTHGQLAKEFRNAVEHVVGAATNLGHEIPKGKIKGEKAADLVTPAEPASRRTIYIGAAAVGTALLIAAVLFLTGNPLELFRAGPPPSIPAPPTLPLPAIASGVPWVEWLHVAKGSWTMPSARIVVLAAGPIWSRLGPDVSASID